MKSDPFLFFKIPYEIAKRTTLTPAAKLVYGVMLRYQQGRLGYCGLANETICELTGLADSTVRASIAQLNDQRCIKTVPEHLLKLGPKDGRTNGWLCLVLILSPRQKLMSMPRARA